MSGPPDSEHYELRQQLRRLSAQHRDVLVPSRDLIKLVDYIDKLEEGAYSAWEDHMGEDL
jgi:hypothetical protein